MCFPIWDYSTLQVEQNKTEATESVKKILSQQMIPLHIHWIAFSGLHGVQVVYLKLYLSQMVYNLKNQSGILDLQFVYKLFYISVNLRYEVTEHLI